MLLCKECGDWGDHEKFLPPHILRKMKCDKELGRERDVCGCTTYYLCPSCGSHDIQLEVKESRE